MTLREWLQINSKEERNRVAMNAGTTVPYLYKLAGGHGKAGWAICSKIEQATGGLVSRHDLRPDIYPQDNQNRRIL